jgi:DNA-binding MarR family transcriptional regulator
VRFARILYHKDSGTLNASKPFGECIAYLRNEQVPHMMQPRKNALHLAKVLETIFKFRSDRGVAHISPTYEANHMDAKLVIEAVRWCMTETLRIFWQGDREKAARAIRELLQFDVPCIGVYADVLLVQRTDLTTEEEILVLLHYAGEVGFTRTELGRHARVSPPSVTRALDALTGAGRRCVVQLSDQRFRLTDLGSKYVREKLADKLLLA